MPQGLYHPNILGFHSSSPLFLHGAPAHAYPRLCSNMFGHFSVDHILRRVRTSDKILLRFRVCRNPVSRDLFGAPRPPLPLLGTRCRSTASVRLIVLHRWWKQETDALHVIASSILSAVKLHDHGILHQDLKYVASPLSHSDPWIPICGL